jgi:hypothetical protein
MEIPSAAESLNATWTTLPMEEVRETLDKMVQHGPVQGWTRGPAPQDIYYVVAEDGQLFKMKQKAVVRLTGRWESGSAQKESFKALCQEAGIGFR